MLSSTSFHSHANTNCHSHTHAVSMRSFRDNVSGLWENLGDTACRITDLQSTLDSMQ